MKLTATLTALYSKRDASGNCYWALRFVDHETGKAAQGIVSGGESNIYGILRVWNPDLDDWDRSVQFQVQALGKREFKRLTEKWKYAGCVPQDLVNFIRQELAQS